MILICTICELCGEGTEQNVTKWYLQSVVVGGSARMVWRGTAIANLPRTCQIWRSVDERCRSRPSGRITTRHKFSNALIWNHLPMGGELKDEHFWIKKWIYIHSCLSTRLQQWSWGDLRGVSCSEMLTADWRLRGNVPYFMNVMIQRGEVENWSFWWVLNLKFN